ncbi:MAG: trypsin-like peptidase domain-containing protein [Verrucomicrobiaceae bacterium]
MSAVVSMLLVSTSSRGAITPQELKATEARVLEVVRKCMPCTVSLIPGGKVPQPGSGSGVIVSEDGLVLTAAHVTMKMNETVTVIFPDGKKVSGKVLGMDYARDSSMVQITDSGKFPFVEVGESKGLKQNDWCVALGHAGGFQADRPPPVRLGRVLDNNLKAFLTSDSALIGGDSGGPLFDLDGKLIGIHSNIGFSLSQNNHVPISTFHENWEALKSGKRFGDKKEGSMLADPDRPVIGAEIEDAPDGRGIVVRELYFGSPAKIAGLLSGDILLKLDDVVITDRETFFEGVAKHKIGDILKLTAKTKDAEKDFSVKLTSARHFQKNRPGATKSTRSESEKKALQAEFDAKMRESLEKGENQFSAEDMKKFKGPQEFQQFMNEFKNGLNPDELEKLAKIGRPSNRRQIRPGSFDPLQPIQTGDDFLREVLAAFRPSEARASQSTHLVFRGTEWRSLCTVIDENGYAVTKASEIETQNNQALTVMLTKDRMVPAEIMKIFPDHDLALIKLKDAAGLTAISLDHSKAELPLGLFISAASSGPDAAAIGVVSVSPRTLKGESRAFLGTMLGPDKQGVIVKQIVSGGAAAKAGIKQGDIITKIDGEPLDSPEKLTRKLASSKPGTAIILDYLRNGVSSAVKLALGDRSKVKSKANAQNSMGTEISDQRSGFQNALQTDLPIIPEECGGPVVDLDGNFVGITIARAGRINTYVLLADDVRRLLEPELEKLGVKKVASKPQPAS